MGKWKPKLARSHPLGGVVASVAEHEEATRAQVRETIGEDREIRATPAWQVPISTVVTELVIPHRDVLDDPNSPHELSVLANLATMAWNVSRIALGTNEGAAKESLAQWAKVEQQDPAFGRLAAAMLAHARTLYPTDTRYILRADVMMKNGQPFVHATSTIGDAAYQAGAPRT